MGKPPEPARIEVDGVEMVAMEPAVYEKLRAYRGQVGAQAARLHALRREREIASAFLHDLNDWALALPRCQMCAGSACPPTDVECARQTLLSRLAARPRYRPDV